MSKPRSRARRTCSMVSAKRSATGVEGRCWLVTSSPKRILHSRQDVSIYYRITPLHPLSAWERGKGAQALFDGDRFGEVARLVDLTATLDRTVVGEELQRHDGRNGLQEIEVRGRVDDVVGDLGNLLVTLGGNGDHLAPAALDLLHIGEHLIVRHVLRRQADGGEAFVNHGNEAVLHLASGAALGVDVGDLFELQGTFQGHRIVVLAANKEK